MLDGAGNGIAVWTVTPASLRRVGLAVEATVGEPASAALHAVKAGQSLGDRPARLAETAKQAEAEGISASTVTERVPRAGDVLVLVSREILPWNTCAEGGQSDPERWEPLRTCLLERNFLRRSVWIDGEDPVRGVTRALAGTGLVCRLETAALELAAGEALLVISCAPRALLALCHTVESIPGVRADPIGRLLPVPPGELVPAEARETARVVPNSGSAS